MNEDELERLFDIFYSEAPYDYVLVIEKKKRKRFLGTCSYDTKICTVYGPDTYGSALVTVFHEIAHANVQHYTHSATWEKEFIRLLTKHKVPKEILAKQNTIFGPRMKEYINGS